MSNLLHGVITVRQAVSGSSFESRLNLLDTLVRDYSPKPELAQLLTAYSSLKHKRHLTPKELMLKQRFMAEINTAWRRFEDNDFELADGSSLREFIGASDAKLLEVLTFKNPSNGDLSTNLFDQYCSYIHDAIKSTTTYPLLDDQTGMLVQLHISTGQLQVGASETLRGQQVGLAVALFQRLPLFELATIKEVIDIRSDLDKYLSRFRSGIIGYTESISSASWDSHFPQDAERVFLRDVEPSLNDIEDAVKSNSYLRQLTKRYAERPNNFIVPAVSLGLTNYLHLPELLALAFGLGPIAANTIDVLNDWRDRFRQIKQNNLFFYYEAQRRMQ